MTRNLLAVAVLVALAAPALAQFDQRVVTLVTADKALIDATPVPTKDVVAQLPAKYPDPKQMRMVVVRACTGVPPDVIQGLLQGLQNSRFVAMLDQAVPDAKLCAR